MMIALLAFAQAHPDTVNANLLFKRGILKLDGVVVNIKKAIAGQSVTSKSPQAEKDLLKADLCEATAIASGQLQALATDSGDASLKARSNWSVSELDRLSEVKLEQAARAVLDDVKAVRQRDPEFTVTEEETLQLESLIGAFVEKKPAPRNTTSKRSTQTASLAQLLTSATTILREQLDKAALKYKKTHPDFYKEYRENRKVMDVAGRKDDRGSNQAN